MVRHRQWSTSSRRLAMLLLAVLLPPAATLVWLGAQLLEQDRVVLEQRELERREAVAEAVASELRRLIGSAELRLEDGPAAAGLARFVFRADRLKVDPPGRVLWTPSPQQLPHTDGQLFAEAERLEYQGNRGGALERFTALAASRDPAVRAGALRRIARVHRQEGRLDKALATYRTLAELRDVSDLGMPVDLFARRSICDVLELMGERAELERYASRLEQDLFASTWSVDEATWDLVIDDLERWRGTAVPVAQDRRVFTAVADLLWTEARDRDRLLPAPLPRLVDVAGTTVTLFTRTSGAEVSIVAVTPIALQAWSAAAVRGAIADAARLALLTPSGTVLAGTPALSGTPVIAIKSPDSGLPWTLTLHSDKWVRAGEQFAYRRRLLLSGLASILLLLAGGSYFLWRVVQRELAISRLQTDFVAAVSHEFRTPLTSLRHVTELLDEDDQMPAHRRRSFYDVYRRNIERLHQLVESLLDFARMEAGRKPYARQPHDAAALATHVVAEFERQGGVSSRRFDLDVSGAAGLQVHADREALVNALRNLLDNAVKYSPDAHTVHVTVAAHPAGVSFTVRDHGLGISRHERQTIFQRFVRGQQAIALGIKGTGLGLAMVAHIARAHDGTIEVDSEEGKGSTFRLILPASAASSAAAPHYEPA